jgi:hypothetical protein
MSAAFICVQGFDSHFVVGGGSAFILSAGVDRLLDGLKGFVLGAQSELRVWVGWPNGGPTLG